ncbi:lactose-binding lectin l-2-like [Seriola dumerili]|uniref:Lactose-binding lectin l-2-like n=1 Tax=Seriola dumerili TaxID=41447 RepID=A0A3B4TVQ7_SERDU|nr:lactose-binding lectin l-2-like [Seriola dumerili]
MILLLFLFGLTLGAESPLDKHKVKLQRGNCPAFWFSFSGRCYKYVATHLTWADAELHCVSEGANLVSIHSLEEEDFVKSLIMNFDHAEGYTWLGLSDKQKEGGWMWSDGCAVKFGFWNPGEPNNNGNEDCVHNNFGNNKKWNGGPCSDTYASVCASRIDCPQLLTFMSNSTS